MKKLLLLTRDSCDEPPLISSRRADFGAMRRAPGDRDRDRTTVRRPAAVFPPLARGRLVATRGRHSAATGGWSPCPPACCTAPPPGSPDHAEASMPTSPDRVGQPDHRDFSCGSRQLRAGGDGGSEITTSSSTVSRSSSPALPTDVTLRTARVINQHSDVGATSATMNVNALRVTRTTDHVAGRRRPAGTVDARFNV